MSERVRLIEHGVVLQDFSGIVDPAEALGAIAEACAFMVKAGMLSGAFYLSAAALFLTAVPMSLCQAYGYPAYGPLLFGVVSAICFFVPGWKYQRQRQLRQSGDRGQRQATHAGVGHRD